MILTSTSNKQYLYVGMALDDYASPCTPGRCSIRVPTIPCARRSTRWPVRWSGADVHVLPSLAPSGSTLFSERSRSGGLF